MIKPTRRAILVFAIGIPIAMLVLAYDRTLWPFSIDAGLLVLVAMASDWAIGFPKRLLQVDIAPPERLFVGEEDHAAVSIRPTRHRLATRFELLLEQTGALEPPELAAVMLRPGDGARMTLRLLPTRRGVVRIEALWIRWKGPLGFVETTRRIGVERSIPVIPNVRAVQRAAIRFFSRDAMFGNKVQHQSGEGSEFKALRDYMPGLDSRTIDWKHSARHKKLLSKEFETERNHHIVLAFDTGYLMAEPVNGLARLDHAINAGLLLAWISLRSGDLVGTYGFDAIARHYQGPIHGARSFARIQQAAAELDYHAEETNFTLGLAELTIRLKRRALVILFTDFVDTVTAELLIESLERIASRHVVVFVTLRDSLLEETIDAAPNGFDSVAKAVVGHDLLRERNIVLERLDRLGIHCLDVASDGLSVGLVNRYLAIKERGLI
jgi:uncharacterized protein (DUF58 family)